MALPLSTITLFSTSPQRLSDPSNFVADMDTRLSEMETNVTEMNTVIGQINGGLSNATILGTVSQSGGSPTGSIMERGSNANGEYVRFADGTQICVRLLSTSSSEDTSWTYPAAFSTTTGLSVVAAPSTSVDAVFVAGRVPNVTTCAFNAWTTAGARIAVGVRTAAIGRWF